MDSFDPTTGKSTTSSTQSYYGSKSGAMPKVILYTLCTDRMFKSSGSALYADDVLEAQGLSTLGPMIKQMRVHINVENSTTNFRYKVNFSWSMLGRVWATPSDLTTAITGDTTSTIGSCYTDDTKFGLNLRFALAISNSSGTAIESGRVSVVLEVELKS